MNTTEAEKYVKRIRNNAKRAYAWAWLHYYKGEWPQPKDENFNLSYMAKQAVRMNLFDLLKGYKVAETV